MTISNLIFYPRPEMIKFCKITFEDYVTYYCLHVNAGTLGIAVDLMEYGAYHINACSSEWPCPADEEISREDFEAVYFQALAYFHKKCPFQLSNISSL